MSTQPTWLTATYLEKILQNFFHDPELKVRDFHVSSGSNLGDGYASQIFRINTKTSTKIFSIIAKVLLKSTAIQAAEEKLNFYEKEKLMLGMMLPKLITKLPSSEKFFPKFYHADDSNRALFIEDLCEDEYRLCEHTSGVDLPHSLLVMEALAKFHASSYLIFKEKPELTKDFEKCFYSKEQTSYIEKTIINNTRKGLLEIIDKVNLPEEYKIKLKNGSDWTSKLIDTWVRKDENINVLIQTDCWANNLMFKYNNNDVEAVKLIDFQLATYNSFAFDLIAFIFSITNVFVRVNHLDTLLDYYYVIFTGIAGDVPNFTKEIFRKEFNERIFFAFLTTIAFTPWAMAPPKKQAVDLDALVKDEESPESIEIFKNPKYLECLEMTLPYFVKNGVV